MKCYSLISFASYRPQRSWAKVMFLQVCVILFTGGRGVCLSACWDNPSPWTDTPHGAEPPQGQAPPSRPPGADTPPPPEQTTAYGQRAAGTHPTGMHSCSLISFAFAWRERVLRYFNILLNQGRCFPVDQQSVCWNIPLPVEETNKPGNIL